MLGSILKRFGKCLATKVKNTINQMCHLFQLHDVAYCTAQMEEVSVPLFELSAAKVCSPLLLLFSNHVLCHFPSKEYLSTICLQLPLHTELKPRHRATHFLLMQNRLLRHEAILSQNHSEIQPINQKRITAYIELFCNHQELWLV